MSSMKFKIDENALRRAVGQQVDVALKDIATRRNADMMRLEVEYGGKPLDAIKPALKGVFEKDGGSLTDPELTQYAEAIRDGVQIRFRPGETRW
jgi:hypothetical protein